MLQYDYFCAMQMIEKMQEEWANKLENYGKQFIGRNLQDCISEIAKDFSVISIYRGNVTFKTYHSRRTKREKWEIETNQCRLNTWNIHKNPILCEEFKGIIKDISTDYCGMYDENNNYLGSTDTVRFILDDSKEFIIENKI